MMAELLSIDHKRPMAPTPFHEGHHPGTMAHGNSPSRCNGVAIYYVCPDIALKSAGIRRLYRHVGVLESAGFEAYILHQKSGFRCSDMPAVPVRYLEQKPFNTNDIIVIPEGCPTIMAALKDDPVRRFVIALNWDYVFKHLPPGTNWHAFNIERVITVSSPIAEMVSWSMGLPTHLLASSIDHRLYYFDKSNKRPHLVYIARKGSHADLLKRLLGARNPAFTRDFKWIGLDGLTESAYADHIRRAAVFLNLSLAEGYPTSCLEAMASGTLVAGYRSMGADALLCGQGPGQNCLLTPIGDYPALAYALEPFLMALCNGEMSMWNRVLSNGIEMVSGLTAQAEAHALISFWQNICSDATTIGEGDEANP